MVHEESQITVLGMGASSGVTFDELLVLGRKTLAKAHILKPDMIATLSSKQSDSVWAALAARFDCALCFFEAERLEAETPRLKNPSDRVFHAVGCHGVAEAAALAGAGSQSILLVEKTVSARASAALARALPSC